MSQVYTRTIPEKATKLKLPKTRGITSIERTSENTKKDQEGKFEVYIS